MAYIESGIAITDDERAVVEKYGFEVKVDRGEVYVLDLTLKSQKKKYRYSGGTLRTLLTEAVAARKLGTSNIVDLAMSKSAAPRVLPAKTVHQEKADAELDAMRAKTREKAPPQEIDADELDNTGKREKRSKREILKKGPRENRYMRAIPFIMGNPSITKNDLAKQARTSVSTASHCLEAWHAYSNALVQKGWLKMPKADSAA